MRSKFALSALVIASLLGTTAIASAQMQPAPGASSEGNVGPGATGSNTGSKMKSGKMKISKMHSGATTGMSSTSHHKSDKADKSGESK